MASISTEIERFIKEKPLGASLDSIKLSLKHRDEETSNASSDDTTDIPSLRAAVSILLTTLSVHPVAKKLKAVSSRRLLMDELASIFVKVLSDDFDLSPLTPLTQAVANNDSDFEIWKAVLQLIDSFSRITPPLSSSIPPFVFGTPFTRSSAAFQDSIQTSSDLEQPLLIELAGCTYEDTGGFHAKHFEGKEYSGQSLDIYKRLSEKHDRDALREFPSTLLEDEV
jgi:hypothetical protein